MHTKGNYTFWEGPTALTGDLLSGSWTSCNFELFFLTLLSIAKGTGIVVDFWDRLFSRTISNSSCAFLKSGMRWEIFGLNVYSSKLIRTKFSYLFTFRSYSVSSPWYFWSYFNLFCRKMFWSARLFCSPLFFIQLCNEIKVRFLASFRGFGSMFLN